MIDPQTHDDLIEVLKGVLDVVSIGAVVGWWLDVMPHAATLFTLIWSVLRVWETDTVQSLVKRWLSRRGK